MIGFIVNPVAGNGQGKTEWSRLERSLRGQGADYRVRETSEEGEAQKLAIELIQKEGVRKIIAVGGDGTVNEVVNGIQQSGHACLFGHVAAGSGNDFARAHGEMEHPWRSVERMMAEDAKRTIDLLKINGRVAVNAVGAGLDGQVAKATNEACYKKWLNQWGLGGAAYVISLIKVLFSYQPCDVTLMVDGQRHTLKKVWLITIANIPNYGGGMLICPQAVPDDGQADICVVGNIGRWGLLRAFPLIYTGGHVRHRGIQFFRGHHIEIQSQRSLFVHADGEVIANTPVTVEVVPRCQAICV